MCFLIIGGQHDGHLPFWLPSFVKLTVLLLHVLFALCKQSIVIHVFRRDASLEQNFTAAVCHVLH